MTKAEAIRWFLTRGWGIGKPTPTAHSQFQNQCGRCLRWRAAKLVALTTQQRAYLCEDCRAGKTKQEDMPAPVPAKFTDFLRAWRKERSDVEKAKRKAEREAAKLGRPRKSRAKKAEVSPALRAAATEAGVPADAATATDPVSAV